MGVKRVALKPHADKIRRWVDEGKGDEWIARELNTTSSSVQSFRSRNSIYRRDPVRRGETSEHPAVLEQTSEGFAVRTRATDSDIFRGEWSGHAESDPGDLRVVITRDRIYLEKVH